ncbi:Nucleolar Complex 2 protein [Entophlyctis luteolus]|nr:Nucleolar Complex 2 protein [Entophlyctis luteolus]
MGTLKQTKKFAKRHLKDKVARSKKWAKDNKGRIAKELVRSKKRQQRAATSDSPHDATTPDGDKGEVDDMGFALSAEQERDQTVSDDEDSQDGDDGDDLGDSESDVSHDEDNDNNHDDDDVGNNETGGSGNDPASAKVKEHLRAEIEEHRRQLDEAMKRDPEFFKFLQENDQDLLDFGNAEDNSDDDEDGADNADDLNAIMKGEKEPTAGDRHDGPVKVTAKILAAWKDSLVNHNSLKVAKKVLIAFRVVVAEGETDGDTEDKQFIIGNEKTANAVTVLALKNITPVFDHFLPAKGTKGKTSLPTSSKNWPKLAPLVKSYARTVIKILSQVSDETMLRFIIREAEKSALYFASFDRLAKDLLKQLLKLWTTTAPETRITCFLAIRRLAITCPNPYLDHAIKSAYQSYNSASRDTNIHTWSSIGFMTNCFVELIGLDVSTGYRFGFVFLRSLASSLRNAITARSTTSFNKVYCWQFINSLRLWTRVLVHFCESGSSAEAAGGKALRPLIYPLVQIILGTMRLKPSSKYLPLRFHCARMIVDVCKKTGVFIPLASHLFEVFDMSELRSSSGKPSTLKPLNFILALKAPTEYIGTRIYQTGIIEELISLLTEYYDCFALSIGFPELAVPAVMQLRRWMKRTQSTTAKKNVQMLVDSLEQNARFIETKRAAVDFAPKDEGKVAAFLADVEDTSAPLRRHAVARRKLRDAQLEELRKSAEASKPPVTFVQREGKSKKKQAPRDESDEESEDELSGSDDADDGDEDDDEELESEDELEFEEEEVEDEEMEED